MINCFYIFLLLKKCGGFPLFSASFLSLYVLFWLLCSNGEINSSVYIIYSLSFTMNSKHRSLNYFRWSYLFFQLCSFLITGKIFLHNVSDTSQLLLCNSFVPSLYFQQTFTFELRLKKFRSKQTNLLCEFKSFLFSTLFNTFQNWTSFAL